MLVGLLLTTLFTYAAAQSYKSNQKRLTTLQTKLTAELLDGEQPQLVAILGKIVGLSASSANPAATFQSQVQPYLKKGAQVISLSLILVQGTKATRIAHVGAQPLTDSKSASTVLLAAQTPTLVTTRTVGKGQQRLAYFMSIKGNGGTYVIAASQELPANHRVTVSANSPDRNLWFALYWGSKLTRANLIETNTDATDDLPFSGVHASATVPMGNSVMTLVASPKGSLVGAWGEWLPYGIFWVGLILSVLAAILAEIYLRRHNTTEALYKQQRDISETLQTSLLPKKMPSIVGWEFGSRYVPATKGADIGGDWYSVVEVDKYRFAFVVGDVTGHDIKAAGIMAALRYTVRTLAMLGLSPSEILQRATRDLDVMNDERFATVLVGVMDTNFQTLTLASAGHPAPLIIHPDRSVEYPRVPIGVPLGVAGPDVQSTTVAFPPGSTLVAYTDGLIEGNGMVEENLRKLASAASSGPTDPEYLIDHLLETLPNADDDVAVLAIRAKAFS